MCYTMCYMFEPQNHFAKWQIQAHRTIYYGSLLTTNAQEGKFHRDRT